MADGWIAPRHKRDQGDRPIRGDRAGRDPFDSTVLEVEAMLAEREREAAAVWAAVERLRGEEGE